MNRGITINKNKTRKRKRIKRAKKNFTKSLNRVDALKEEYVEKGLDKMENTFVLYRIIGNDLYPRHQKGQTLSNLQFILENEPNLENCEKRWIINRIFDKDLEQAIIEMLRRHQQEFIHIPFLNEEYKKIELDTSFLPTPNFLESKEYARMEQQRRKRIIAAIIRNKNKYVMNVNGARNTALRDGKFRAKWVLPWDGNCFVTQMAWKQICSDVIARPYLKYFAVPMTRVLENKQLLADTFIPVPVEEPQLIFRLDANEEFNENFWYGRRDKVELLWRLGISGKWDYWKDDFWDSKRLPFSKETGQHGQAGWVARLFSGMTSLEKNSKQRNITRFEAIIKTIQYLDEEVLKHSSESDNQIYTMLKKKNKINTQFEITGDHSSDNVKQTLLEQLDQVDNYFETVKIDRNNNPVNVEVAFAISLKSKRSSRNWTRVQNNLARTLRSILNNTDQNFKIVIAGHEKPNIEEMENIRVTWLPVRYPPPKYISKFSSDKFRKRRVIGAYLRKIGFSGYFMPLDADDWVHYRFVEFIRSHPIKDAFVMNTGCMANFKNKQVWLRDGFYFSCGSSAVFYFRNNDFPLTSRKADVIKTKFKWVILAHGKVTKYLKNKNYLLVNFPFVTWVVAHGDNNTIIKRKLKRTISANSYNAIPERLENWFYQYFKIWKRKSN
ncbi:glycosyltransferase family A protein [Neobacillus niacini]|uniref:glycosyltransferase family A protein n=1 Tax=Neobacillus niacini TaxID=86668 RepID=UPI0039830F9B